MDKAEWANFTEIEMKMTDHDAGQTVSRVIFLSVKVLYYSFEAFVMYLWLTCIGAQTPCLLLQMMVKCEIFDLSIKTELYQHIP